MMDIEAQLRQQFFTEQNILLRKRIRELDLQLAGYSLKEQQKPSTLCVFLVLGAPGSGKSSLLQSLQLSLNGSYGWGKTRHGTVSTYQIKRGARWQVEGVREVKETDSKYTILGLQLHSQEKSCTRYKRALEFVDSGMIGCLQQGPELNARVKICLICIDPTAELPYQQLTYLRFLKVDLSQRHIKTFFILTHTDRQSLSQSNKCLWLEGKLAQTMKELDIKEREDIIVIQNYHFNDQKESGKLSLNKSQHPKVQHNQEINYYLLQLVIKILSQHQRVSISNSKFKGWLCG